MVIRAFNVVSLTFSLIARTDPSKNIVRGFISYEKLLRYHPELHGQVQFWAFLQPSRQDVPAYIRYLREIRQTAARINSEHGTEDWTPIRLEIAEIEAQIKSGHLDVDGLCLALADWSAELGLLLGTKKSRRGDAPAAGRIR